MSLFDGYDTGKFYDEMFQSKDIPRSSCKNVFEQLNNLSPDQFKNRCDLAEMTLVNQGITFTVYGDNAAEEKPFPVDLIPRVIPADEWKYIVAGLTQRVRALNLFLYDIYHDQKILKDGIIPRELVVNAPNFRREFMGADIPMDTYVHICGSDLIRDDSGQYRILEDNCRTPSGVSYVLQNRIIMKRVFPHLFRENSVRPVDHYTTQLLENLRNLAPSYRPDPTIVLLTPGLYNSAYYEHCFLAQELGIELIEGRDLYVDDNIVYMKTTRGPQRVDVIYRRVDDDFLDPVVFRSDSALGVPGLVNAYRAGNVALANGIGTGVADDKVIYAYVPKMIDYYLKEEAIIPNVDTFLAWEPSHLDHIVRNAHKLVIKSANESGGYGMLIGPQGSREECAEFVSMIKANPRNYIAQPLIELSRCPSYFGDHCEGRHVDLRPFILCGKEITIIPGGLTRVALRKDSYVVNSSQGGGSKDTWLLGNSDHAPDKDADWHYAFKSNQSNGMDSKNVGPGGNQ